MTDTVKRLMALADEYADEKRLGFSAEDVQRKRQALEDELVKLFTPLTDEPAAWLYWHPRDDTFDGPHTIRKKAVSKFTEDTRREWVRQGWEFEPLYTASQE